MTNPTEYYINWLAERYRFDTAARNPEIEQKFLKTLPPKDTISLVDVGAGTGANCRYLMEKIPAHQHWTLIEQNPGFSRASLRILEEHGRQQGYASFLEGNTLLLQQPAKTIRIVAVQGSLLDTAKLVDLSHTQAVVSNAVFDLFPPARFDDFVRTLAPYQPVFLSTLNYENMYFSPRQMQDEKMISLYHAHMRRPQPEGTAMGPGCVPQMREILKKHNYKVDTGSSKWQIHPEDEKMRQYLLNFMEASIAELSLTQEETLALKAWIRQKEQSADFTLTIGHQDILGYF